MVEREIEVRRSKRRRRTVSAYRDGDKVVVLIPASMTKAQEAEWVETMVARLDKQDQRRRPSDEQLFKRAMDLSTPYFAGIIEPDSVRWMETQNPRWGSCTPGDRAKRLSPRPQGMPGLGGAYVLGNKLANR